MKILHPTILSAGLLSLGLVLPAAAGDQGSMVCKANEHLIGKDIKDENGKTIGEVEELMVDLENSRVAYAIVSLEGLVGNDDQLYVLPWGAVCPTGNGDHAVCSVAANDLRAAPSFPSGEAWPSLSNDPWPKRVYAVGKAKPYWNERMPRVFKASEVSGWDVRNAKDEDLGEIEEFVVDTDDGSISYAVLTFGGFLGMGEKLFAVPTASLRADVPKERFVLDVEKERLKSAPGFAKDAWPDMASPTFRSEMTAYYGEDDRGKEPRDRAASAGLPGHLMKSKDLVGTDVRNRQIEKLGAIEEVVLDLDEGRIAYAVISFGGFLGMGDKLFAVPTEALKFSPDGEKIVIDADKERLENAPGFDKEHWPGSTDRAWLKSVFDYYRVHPYWVPSPPPADR
jgi:sporulation protein YlmC with PRC-barrel domain